MIGQQRLDCGDRFVGGGVRAVGVDGENWLIAQSFANRAQSSAVVDPRQDSEEVDAATFMRAADAALYEAKRRGRNRVVSASPRQLTGHGDIWEPLPLPATRPTDHAGEP